MYMVFSCMISCYMCVCIFCEEFVGCFLERGFFVFVCDFFVCVDSVNVYLVCVSKKNPVPFFLSRRITIRWVLFFKGGVLFVLFRRLFIYFFVFLRRGGERE